MIRVVAIGRLCRDPELRFTPSGVAVCNFTLAVDRKFKNTAGEKQTDFFNVVVWRGLAESCGNYLAKGKLAAVDGRLENRSYEAKDGSGKRTVTEIIADDVQFLSPREQREPGEEPEEPATFPSQEEDLSMPLDDLPF